MPRKKPQLVVRTSASQELQRSFTVSESGVFAHNGFSISKGGIQESPNQRSSEGQAAGGGERRPLVKSLEELQLLEVVGHGSGGVVHRAVHKPSRAIVAVKSINVLDDEKRRQLMRELHTLHHSSNESIVVFHGAFYDDCHVYVVLEYMDGGSLQDVLRKAGPMPESVVADIAQQVVRGLHYLHRSRYQVHRDVKPGNMLIDMSASVKLTDFGVTAELADTLGQCDTFLGTARYMAPEALAGQPYNYTADLWSLGICLVEFATGKYPYAHFKCSSHWELLDKIQSNELPSLPAEQFSEDFRSFVGLCLQLESQQRPPIQDMLTHPFVNFSPSLNRQGTAQWLHSQLEQFSSDLHIASAVPVRDELLADGHMCTTGPGGMEDAGEHSQSFEDYAEESFEDYRESPSSQSGEQMLGGDSCGQLDDSLLRFDSSAFAMPMARPAPEQRQAPMDLSEIMRTKKGRHLVRQSLDELSGALPAGADLGFRSGGSSAQCARRGQWQRSRGSYMQEDDVPEEEDDDEMDLMSRGMEDGDGYNGRDNDVKVMMSPGPERAKPRSSHSLARVSASSSAGGQWLNSSMSSEPDTDETAAAIRQAMAHENELARGSTPPLLASALGSGSGSFSSPHSGSTPTRIPRGMSYKSRMRSPASEEPVAMGSPLTGRLQGLTQDEQLELLLLVHTKLEGAT